MRSGSVRVNLKIVVIHDFDFLHKHPRYLLYFESFQWVTLHTSLTVTFLLFCLFTVVCGAFMGKLPRKTLTRALLCCVFNQEVIGSTNYIGSKWHISFLKAGKHILVFPGSVELGTFAIMLSLTAWVSWCLKAKWFGFTVYCCGMYTCRIFI